MEHLNEKKKLYKRGSDVTDVTEQCDVDSCHCMLTFDDFCLAPVPFKPLTMK